MLLFIDNKGKFIDIDNLSYNRLCVILMPPLLISVNG